MSLPEEIIIQIVTEVDADKKWFLDRSTVSRPFVKACQQLLYRDIAIVSFNGQRRCRQLYQLLSDSPHISRYIRQFSLQTGLSRNIQGAVSLWLLDEPLVPSLLLKSLNTLRSISLICASSHPLKWSDMDPRLQQSFQCVFALSSLQKISLSNTRFPAHIIAGSRGLAHLSVRRSPFEGDPPNAIPQLRNLSISEVEKPRLRTLSMTSKTDGAFVERMTSTLDLSDLWELTVFDTDPTTIRAVTEFMQLSAASLRRFKWDVPETFRRLLPTSGDNYERCPLFISPSLRHVEVGVHDWPHSEEIWNPVAWAVRALYDLAEASTDPVNLETLTIWIMTIPYHRFGPEVVTEWWWGELDRTLSKRAIFQQLRKVTITTADASLQGKSREMWTRSIREEMPRLAKMKILELV